jgi:hypothetical protein
MDIINQLRRALITDLVGKSDVPEDRAKVSGLIAAVQDIFGGIDCRQPHSVEKATRELCVRVKTVFGHDKTANVEDCVGTVIDKLYRADRWIPPRKKRQGPLSRVFSWFCSLAGTD